MPTAILTTDPLKLYHELHATAVAIVQAKERNDAPAVRALRDHFVQIAAAFRETGAGDLTAMDRLILSAGEWLEGSAKAGAQLVRDATKLAGDAAGNVTKPLLPALWPVALAALAVALLLFAPEIKALMRKAGK